MLKSSLIGVAILFALASVNVEGFRTYSQHQLWRLNITNNAQVAKMLEFRRFAHRHDIDFWSDEIRRNLPVGHLFLYVSSK